MNFTHKKEQKIVSYVQIVHGLSSSKNSYWVCKDDPILQSYNDFFRQSISHTAVRRQNTLNFQNAFFKKNYKKLTTRRIGAEYERRD